jgi:hypothetical protein
VEETGREIPEWRVCRVESLQSGEFAEWRVCRVESLQSGEFAERKPALPSAAGRESR